MQTVNLLFKNSGGATPSAPTMKDIIKYCKDNRIRFVRTTCTGFISCFKVPVYAGMEYRNGKIISIPIRQIGKKTLVYHHKWMGDCYVWDGELKNYNIKKL